MLSGASTVWERSSINYRSIIIVIIATSINIVIIETNTINYIIATSIFIVIISTNVIIFSIAAIIRGREK